MCATTQLLAGYKKYNISRNLVLYSAINHFHLAEEVKPAFSFYQIFHYSPDFIKDNISSGVYTRHGKQYLIVWKDCTPYSLRQHSLFKLSFRCVQEEYGIGNYVLITPATTQNNITGKESYNG